MSADYGKVAVLMGGPSAERKVSLKSGEMILNALLENGVDAFGIDADHQVLTQLQDAGADRVFIALHGPWGEDGTIQGALEIVRIPYTGSGVQGSSLAMDKVRSKNLWRGTGIPTPEYVELPDITCLQTAATKLGLPIFVKPAREGSSIGITKVGNVTDLESAWQLARELDQCVIAETCIEGQELTIGILGDRALPIIRLETPRTFYDYQAKYHADTTLYHCPSGLSAELETRLQKQAWRAFDLLGCRGWGRVDLMLDRDNNPYFLEVNTIPGMTDHSLVPMAAKAAGMSFNELVMSIMEISA